MAVYLKYVLKTTEPIRIADESTSQRGQAMTLRYIPGSTIRGIVINQLAREDDFEEIKRALFSKEVKYQNAYPSVRTQEGHHELLPAPKGFYEDKSEQTLKNVVIDGDFDDGMKRAKIGRFAYLEDGKIYYYNVKTSSDMKILANVSARKERNVFRNEYISQGTEFTGYILAEDERLRSRIKDVMCGTIQVGNARSAGYGKCEVNCREWEGLPYEKHAAAEALPGECYMMLLSNTVMRNQYGELCGLDLKTLEKKMGVSDLEILYCATSTVNVKGYNRTWGGRNPSATMYEAGSVFHFKYQGTLQTGSMEQMAEEGIGIRTNEGFGQVIFLGSYEKAGCNGKQGITPEQRGSAPEKTDGLSRQEKDTLRLIAKAYYRQQLDRAMEQYILKHPLSKGSESRSRLGILESFATAYRYHPDDGIRLIKEFYTHAEEKERKQTVHQERGSMEKIKEHVKHVLEKELETFLEVDIGKRGNIMGFPKAELLTEEEQKRVKLEFLTREIRFENKEVH